MRWICSMAAFCSYSSALSNRSRASLSESARSGCSDSLEAMFHRLGKCPAANLVILNPSSQPWSEGFA